jgi:hypothetical protein
MPSRADTPTLAAAVRAPSRDAGLRVLGSMLHGVGLLSIAALLWRLLTPAASLAPQVTIDSRGAFTADVAAMLAAPSDTTLVQLDGTPSARTRALLNAVRGSGRVVRLNAAAPLRAIAITADERWRTDGGTQLRIVAGDTSTLIAGDAAGLLDSLHADSSGLSIRTGPVQGAATLGSSGALASVAPRAAGQPTEGRVLVLGAATWETKFLVSALEEAGWPVDVSVSVSPKLNVSQGPTRVPSRRRHAVVIALPGASSTALVALPAFVHGGGGLVIVGEAARVPALSSIRAGTPGTLRNGELGAEASATDPRRGLDLVPIVALAADGIAIESQGNRIAIAGRRVGAGRVVQVGYDNSWLWRMAGSDDAPSAHRRWWSTLVANVVPLTSPLARVQLDAEHDTLDAAPVAALARDLGLPSIVKPNIATLRRSAIASLDPRWLLALALISLLASWTLRRWRGLA